MPKHDSTTWSSSPSLRSRCFIFRALQGYKCLRIRTSDALAGNSSRKTAFTGALVGRNPEGLSGAPQTWKLKGSKFQPALSFIGGLSADVGRLDDVNFPVIVTGPPGSERGMIICSDRSGRTASQMVAPPLRPTWQNGFAPDMAPLLCESCKSTQRRSPSAKSQQGVYVVRSQKSA
ncbi:uncharacterized protein K489DRAFT_368327 [Dissoconium aciculare CBS 342.82]|uniref:Uncharacterized protein n=1 Tax=Dissoconium aciculare CBS 342.82 TaxID=1314786 RepID=A0A6J3ME54_9PEZI|nr:uncharacterized protein K489DRAFT_368327 [Dissoconium aciculare CBS 342.82]KAF1825132.1 hypothetical protein K489DRAFT_368327 [Dissoconium aciculare CBS 342.82]